MRTLRYTSSAIDDLADIAAYVAEATGSRASGERFAERLRRQCTKLATLPTTLGRTRAELRPDIRSFPFAGYVIFFRYLDKIFEVVNILERHRDAGLVFGEDRT